MCDSSVLYDNDGAPPPEYFTRDSSVGRFLLGILCAFLLGAVANELSNDSSYRAYPAITGAAQRVIPGENREPAHSNPECSQTKKPANLAPLYKGFT